MNQRLPSSELSEWMAWSEIEPFGEFAESLQLAKIGCMIVNTIRGLIGAEPLAVSEFLVKTDPPEPMESSQMNAALASNPFFRKVE
ncbi:MAG: hypothetical protein LLF76_02995 [Planctomycetaceae bacterium]|nr:hypothetical protein [Planctomycetaceae bacterium]